MASAHHIHGMPFAHDGAHPGAALDSGLGPVVHPCPRRDRQGVMSPGVRVAVSPRPHEECHGVLSPRSQEDGCDPLGAPRPHQIGIACLQPPVVLEGSCPRAGVPRLSRRSDGPLRRCREERVGPRRVGSRRQSRQGPGKPGQMAPFVRRSYTFREWRGIVRMSAESNRCCRLGR